MRAFLIASVAVVLTSCNSTPPTDHQFDRFEMNEMERTQVESSVLSALHASVGLFSGVQAVSNPTGKVVLCGWVRLKADDIDYLTFPENRPFAARYSRGALGIRDFQLTHFARERQDAGTLYRHCGGFGISV